MSHTGKEEHEHIAAHRALNQVRYWETQDGRRLLPREMTTEHLHNILRMSIRNYQLKAFCRAANPDNAIGKTWLRIACSTETMRAVCFAIRPILRDIEAELLHRSHTK